MRRWGFILAADSLRQADGPRRVAEGIAQRTFDFIGPVASARLGRQIMIGHLAIGVAAPVETAADRAQHDEPFQAVLSVAIDRLAPIAA